MAKAEYWDGRKKVWVFKTSESRAPTGLSAPGAQGLALYGAANLITRSSSDGKVIDKIRSSTMNETKVKTETIKKEKPTQTKKQLQNMWAAANISRTGNKSELAAKLKGCLSSNLV